MDRHPATLTRPAAGEISSAREYYGRILPFYEKESLARAHLAFWRALARESRPRRILEIGAGLGRITSALAGVAPAIGLDVCLRAAVRGARVSWRRTRGALPFRRAST